MNFYRCLHILNKQSYHKLFQVKLTLVRLFMVNLPSKTCSHIFNEKKFKLFVQRRIEF